MRFAAALLASIFLFVLGASVARAAPQAHRSVGFQPGPLSVASDAAGTVYLSNPQANGQVQRFSADGVLLARWGNFGWDPGNSAYPRSLATDAAGNVYVADSRGGLVQAFTPDGVLLRQWDVTARDIAVDPAGNLYAIGRSQVIELAPDGSQLGAFGGPGAGDGQLGEPWGIALGAGGNVYVADTYRSRVVVFSAEGAFVSSWGSHGRGPGEFVFPYGIATDGAGNVYVADTANNRVQKFSAAGAYIGMWGSAGRGPGRFYTPMAVDTDPAGDVYVVDAGVPYLSASGEARVQRFTADGQLVTGWRDAPALPRPRRPRILAGPRGKSASRGAVLRFRSRQPGVRFQCRLTGQRVPRRLRRWRRCTSPKRYARLRPGRKVFHVRALAGREAGGAARRAWKHPVP